ncbi:D/-alanyl-D/-alanine carboxypeptidase [Caudoviricetes sp.]|nr:D/-alanyl-D/-alanine carboxypeptidase [Caudoviricetes sp.]
MNTTPVYLPVTRPVSANGDPLVNGKLGPCDLKPVYFAGVGNLDLFPTAAQSFECMVLVCYQETGLHLSGTGAFRSYLRQVQVFNERYTPTYDAKVNVTHSTRTWDGKKYYLRRGMLPVAVPGTSNHGLGIAVDLGWWQGWNEPGLADIDGITNAAYKKGWDWLMANYQSFGWSHEGAKPGQPGYEAHHIRYVLGNAKSQRVLDLEKLFGTNK